MSPGTKPRDGGSHSAQARARKELGTVTLDAAYFSDPNPDLIPDQTLALLQHPFGWNVRREVGKLRDFARDSRALGEKDYSQLEPSDIESHQRVIAGLTGIDTRIVRNSDRNHPALLRNGESPVLCAIRRESGKEVLYVRESLLGSDNRHFSHNVLARHLGATKGAWLFDRLLQNQLSAPLVRLASELAYTAAKRVGWPLELSPQAFASGMLGKYAYRWRYRWRLSSTALVPFAPITAIKGELRQHFLRSNLGKTMNLKRVLGLVESCHKEVLDFGRSKRDNARVAGRLQAGLEAVAPFLAQRLYGRDRTIINHSGVDRSVYATRVALELAASGASPALVCAALIHQLPGSHRSKVLYGLAATDPVFADLVDRIIRAYGRVHRQFPTSSAMPPLIPKDADPSRLFLDASLRNKSARYVQLITHVAEDEQQKREEWLRANYQGNSKKLMRVDAPDLLRLHQACVHQSVATVTNKADLGYLRNLQRGITRLFSPMASRLQQIPFDRELRNAYFRATNPDDYAMVLGAMRGPHGLGMSYQEADQLLRKLQHSLRARLEELGLPKDAIEIYSRPKDPESLHRKWRDEGRVESGKRESFDGWLSRQKDLLGLMVVVRDRDLFCPAPSHLCPDPSRPIDYYSFLNNKVSAILREIFTEEQGLVESVLKRVDYLGNIQSSAWHHCRVPHSTKRAQATLPLEIQLRSKSHLIDKYRAGGKGERALPHDALKAVRGSIIDLQETFGLSPEDARRLPEQVFDHFPYRETLKQRVQGMADDLKHCLNVEYLARPLAPSTDGKQRKDFKHEQFFRVERLPRDACTLDLLVSTGLNPATHEVCEAELEISERDGFTREIRQWKPVYWDEKLSVEKVYVIKSTGVVSQRSRFDAGDGRPASLRARLLAARRDLAHASQRDEWGSFDPDESYLSWSHGVLLYAREFENLDLRLEQALLERQLAERYPLRILVRFDETLLDRFVFNNGLRDAAQLFEAIGRGLITARELRTQYDQDYVNFRAGFAASQGSSDFMSTIQISQDENQRGILSDVIRLAEECGIDILSAGSQGEDKDIQLRIDTAHAEPDAAQRFVGRISNLRRPRGINIPDPAGITTKARLSFSTELVSLSQVFGALSRAGVDIVDFKAQAHRTDGSNTAYYLDLTLKGPAVELSPDLNQEMNAVTSRILDELFEARRNSAGSAGSQVVEMEIYESVFELSDKNRERIAALGVSPLERSPK